jgi:hypothetical protein
MQSFVDYLINIAPEGETILFVQQKPKMRKGEPETHNDGSPKYVWIPHLPYKAPLKRKAAWYANTGCFIVERFKEGLSASAQNCERVAFMVLDDIGTKSSAPPIEPTWKLETSPGNYQWGYTFGLDDQPMRGEFNAAIKAMAEAGFTDPGAVNPVRNFRIPGSVNLKEGRNNFEAVLTEFHPEREFTLDQIITACGVTPGPVDTAYIRGVYLEDDGLDTVLEWIRERGLLLDKANGEGWYGVVCPNHAAHTTGDPGGRYNPVNRSYTCFHGHCEEWDSERFLRWVESEGGPKTGYGLRDDLLAKKLGAALSKITPNTEYPDEAAKVIKEVERRELGRVEKAGWYERFAYVIDDDAYFDLVERQEITRTSFNALYRHVTCHSIHNNRRIEASVCFDENRQAMGARVLTGVTFAAGESVLCSRSGLVYGNRWRNARPEGVLGDVTPWLEHAERMIPDPAEREHVLDVMAYKRQHPERKINHAVLHAGKPGSGKDTLWAPFLHAIGGDVRDRANIAIIKNEELSSQWGYAFESEVIVINELRQAEAKDRRALENSLKPVIAAPPETLTVNRKGLHPYDALNRVFVLSFSNERAAISLPSNDRRWFVLWSEAERMTTEAAAALWGWYQAGGFAAVTAWLDARDVSAFNPGATPPMTEAKAIMIESAMSTAESFLVDMIRRRQGDFARGVIASPFYAICDRLQGLAPSGVKVVPAALMHALREAEWIDCGRVHSREYPTKKHVFAHPQFAALNRSDLRRMAEGDEPALSIVGQ